MRGRDSLKNRGKEAFENWYAERFGKRWPALRESLLAASPAYEYGEGLVKPYALDKASVLAALSLDLPEGGLFLDACAAPGGKSLVIASRLKPGAALLSNELSAARRRRLSNTLDDYLDPEKRGRVTVSGFDAAAAGGRKSEWGRFDAILLDAPCSSERHVIKSETALGWWSPARPRFLAQRQWALLSSCFLMLREGGCLVYSSCALGEEENDGVLQRLFEKYSSAALPEEAALGEGEKTRYGSIILPDTRGGMGPMYIARVRKRRELTFIPGNNL
ncbi:MAG: 16S rRNA methyltransferase [Treponema sp.]|jgi:16S rRNA (cytosine1407-C5)-methyltransferase|nr:16S rRNA methyltransferase [Treponema sp.]